MSGKSLMQKHAATSAFHRSSPHFILHHHGTLSRQSANKTLAACKRSQEKYRCRPSRSNSSKDTQTHTQRVRLSSDHRETCGVTRSAKATGWVLVWDQMAYFLVALCLCADSPTGFDGGGTSQSRDPCRHSLVSDSDSLSCPRGKLLCERRLDVNTAQLEMAKVAVSQRSNEYPVS